MDELANSAPGFNGKEEMTRCEQVFKQVCWLEERFWPDVDGMGEEDERGGHGDGIGSGLGDAGFGAVLNGVAEAAGGAT